MVNIFEMLLGGLIGLVAYIIYINIQDRRDAKKASEAFGMYVESIQRRKKRMSEYYSRDSVEGDS